MTPRGRVKLTTEVDENLWEAIHLRAIADRKKVREVMVEALEKYLGVKPKKRAK